MKPEEIHLREERDKLLIMLLGAFTRKVHNTWIDPKKSHSYFEDLRRVFYTDKSHKGLYPAIIIPQHLLNELVVVIPIEKFKEMFRSWCNDHPEKVEVITQSSSFSSLLEQNCRCGYVS